MIMTGKIIANRPAGLFRTAGRFVAIGIYSGGQMSYAVKSTQTKSRVFGMAASSAFPIVLGGSLKPLHHVLSD